MEDVTLSDLNLVLPKVETEAAERNYGRFIISPLERGYGDTVGHSLRRILLASLPGAAISAIKISGVHHAFSEIPHVNENMTDLVLNLRRLRFRVSQEEPVRLQVAVKGEAEISAGDIEVPDYVEIVNPDLHLLTGNSAETDIEIELQLDIGLGYSSAEDRANLADDEIPIDAIFSPVQKAVYRVERARVGQATDYDRLVMEITTDGSITPHEAVRQAALLAVKHFALIADTDVELLQEPEEVEEDIPDSSALDFPIEELELSVRTYNSLKRAGITLVSEVIERLKRGANEILSIRNFGQKSSDELLDKLAEKSYLDEVDPSIIQTIRAGGR